jgi:hypothetical protein
MTSSRPTTWRSSSVNEYTALNLRAASDAVFSAASFKIGSIRGAIWAVFWRRVRRLVLVVTIKNNVEAQHHFGVAVDIIDLNKVSDKTELATTKRLTDVLFSVKENQQAPMRYVQW